MEVGQISTDLKALGEGTYVFKQEEIVSDEITRLTTENDKLLYQQTHLQRVI